MKASAATADIADDARAAPYVLGAAWVAAFSLLVYLAVLWPRLLLFSVGFSYQTPLSAFTVVLLLGAILVLFVRPAVLKHYHGSNLLGVGLCLFVALALCKYVSAFAGQDPAGSISVLNNTLLYYMSLFVIGLVLFVEPRNTESFPRQLLIAGLIAAALGVYEMIRQNALTVEFGGIFNLGSTTVAGENLKANMYRGGFLRAKSTFVHPLVFGQYVAACLPLAFAIGTEGRGKVLRWILALGLLAAAMVASNTRSPFALGVIGLASYFALAPLASHKSRQLVVVFVLGAAVAALAFLIFGDDLFSMVGGRTAEEASSSQVRNVMLERALFALEGSPLIGYGEGLAVLVAGVYESSGTLTIDSLYLSYLINNGIIGFSVFVAFFLFVMLAGIRALRRISDDKTRRHLRAIIAFTYTLMFGQSVLSIQDNLVFAYLGAAYIVAVSASAQKRQPAQGTYISPTTPMNRL